jgi:putative hydroxymethylpyrimidine transport system permease protein
MTKVLQPSDGEAAPPRSNDRQRDAAFRQYAGSALILLFIVVVWQLLLTWLEVPKFLMPAPSDIADSLQKDLPRLMYHAGVTLTEVVLGFVLALVAGLATALALHMSAMLRSAVFPILVASQAIPIIVIAPILVVILGFGIWPKLVMVALICFFPIVVTTTDGLQSADPLVKRMMATLHADRWAILRRVEIPGALPMMFSGVRIAATYAAIGAIVGEWSGSSAGLGFYMQQNAAALATSRIFAAVIVLCTMSFALLGIVSLIERLVAPWSPRFAGKSAR